MAFQVGDKVKTDGAPHNSRAMPNGNADPIGSIPPNSPGTVVAPGEVPDQGRPAPATQTNVKYDDAKLAHGYMSTPNLILVSSGQQTGTIAGTVTGAGTALAGCEVKVSDTQKTTTGADGRYSLASLPAGAYTVAASAAGYTGQSAPATVTANQTATVNFTLAAETSDDLEPRITKLESQVEELNSWRAEMKQIS